MYGYTFLQSPMCGSKDVTGNRSDDNHHNLDSCDDTLDKDNAVDVSDDKHKLCKWVFESIEEIC